MMKRCALILALLWSLPAAALQVGDIPPDPLGVDFSGRPVHVSDYRGKIVIATFWASWCAPCMSEMGRLEDIQRQLGHSQLQIIGVNYRESAQAWRQFRTRFASVQLKLTFDPDASVVSCYQVDAVPTMLMIDRSGRIAHAHRGYTEATSVQGLVAELNALLSTPPLPPERSRPPY
ncbi:TlpA family protein disulfide reductase [Hydrocarboniphaga sp.]|uniref:TlpA family protein disulfide reductase n=1 Tax=Hydrocarboniphaga sp. TaxID=2033016 RepID=UPI003D13179D